MSHLSVFALARIPLLVYLVSALGSPLQVMASGTHLIALPHADGDGPIHHFVPAPPRLPPAC